MACDTCTITVFFQDPFWVGLLEREEGNRYWACKLIFGAEPRDYEVYETLLAHWRDLKFSPSLPAARAKRAKENPRRARREAVNRLSKAPVGTKAQEALKLQRAEGKELRREKSREERQAEAERKFRLRQEKRRQKHRGR